MEASCLHTLYLGSGCWLWDSLCASELRALVRAERDLDGIWIHQYKFPWHKGNCCSLGIKMCLPGLNLGLGLVGFGR